MDDLIIMRRSDSEFLVVVNAANTTRDLALVEESARSLDVEIDDITDSTAMIAVQGPRAAAILQPLVTAELGELKRFRSADTEVAGAKSIVSRTGYTGEDGFELIIHDATTDNPAKAKAVWDVLAKSASPCGLAARDSLRLEAGYPLHGFDIDEKTNPFETGLSWVISAGKTGYAGYDAVSKLRVAPRSRSRRGIVLDEGIPRHGFRVLDAQGGVVGHVTSGTFSPLVRKGIALALVRTDMADTSHAWVEVRGAGKAGRYVGPPFYDESLYGWKRDGNGK
jgi:glycine cleavage system T protein (aminomethyltransferase)